MIVTKSDRFKRDILLAVAHPPTCKSGDEGYPSEIGISDMTYVGYAPPLADSNTFLRFILNPRRLCDSSITVNDCFDAAKSALSRYHEPNWDGSGKGDDWVTSQGDPNGKG